MPHVTNWKQIQARIRKARTGADAPAKLLNLFEKTRDAMVAYELARAYEAGNRSAEAIEWYSKSWERFRREDWKKRAAEAIARLGGTPPVSVSAPEPSQEGPAPGGEAIPQPEQETPSEPRPSAARPFGSGLPPQLFHASAAVEPGQETERESSEFGGVAELAGNGARRSESVSAAEPGPAGGAGAPAGLGKRRRRRGRRGGRGRHKPRGSAPGAASAAASQTPGPAQAELPRAPEIRAAAATPPPPAPEEAGWLGPKTEALRARAGDPALASQIAQLEMQLRRLIACPPHALADANEAPAGPGVLILSDADLTTHYYIVACATLRIEMGRLGKSDRAARGRGQEPSLRARLAEHLGISESQVTRYLNQHCVARWLQLDDGAPRLAHFAIAVLRPALND